MATNPSLFGHVLAGRYRLDQRRGTGAHGIVLDAVDQQENRQVAVKILRPQYAATSAAEARFRFEAQLAASLDHPNLNTVFDWGVEVIEGAKVPYLVLEHLSGGSLRDMIDRGRLLSPSQALMIGLDVCRGLDHLHRNGIIHRDIKPANLAFGDDRHLRILDVGISRMMAEQTWRDPVTAGIDAARYASPEQARGATPDAGLTTATDIYSLALTLIESVTGQVPFSSDSTVATLSARIDKLMPVSADFGPLASVLSRAGSAVPEDRYSAAAMGRALVQAAEKMPRPAPMPIVGVGGTDTLFANAPTTGGVPISQPAGGADPTTPLPRPTLGGGPPIASPPGAPPIAPPASAGTPAPAASPLLPAGAAPSPVASSTGDDRSIVDIAAGTPAPAAPTAAPAGTASPAAVPDSPSVTEPRAPMVNRGSNPASMFANATVPSATTSPVTPMTSTMASPSSPAAPVVPPATPADLFGGAPPPPMPDASESGSDEVPDTGYDPNVEYKPPRSKAKIAIGVLVLLAVIAVGAFVFLRVTKDETFAVPDLANQQQAVAQNQVAEYDWNVTVETERSELVAAGNVIRTEPPTGEKVEKGGDLTLVVSAGPPLSTLPDVTGQTVDAATAALEDARIGISVDEEVFSEDVPAGTIITWTVPAQGGLAPGDQVMPNTISVSVVVSKGPEPRIVPSLLGLDVEAATQTLASLQLVIAQDPTAQLSNAYPTPGQIVAQSQPEGTSVERGATITVAVSAGPDLVAVPPLGGLTYDQIEQALTAAGLTVGNITGDKVTQTITDATYEGASLQPGQLLPRGAAVDLLFT